MSNVVCWVESVSMPDPYDVIGLHGSVTIEGVGPSSPWSWSAYPAVGASDDDIADACLAAASAVAVAHSYTVTSARLLTLLDLSGMALVPVAASAPSISIGSDFQATDTTRPARFTISGTWSVSISATGNNAGTIQLKAGASANPSTVVDDAQPGFNVTLVLGVALTPIVPWKLAYELPAGHYGRVVVASGTGFAITHVQEQRV